MIPQSTIDKILDAASIYDVVSDYVTLRRAGANYKGLCPFHDDTTPSFSVSPAKNLCKCFACGKGGNPVHFIMEIEQLNFYEAIKFLGKKYGIEVEERELTPEQRKAESERESMFAVNEWVSNYFHDTLLNSTQGQAVGMVYFRGRGFRDDIIEKFRLGFCLDQNDTMSAEAISKGYNPDYLVKTGLSFKTDKGQYRDKYRGRVIFPWFGLSGKITGFGGRVLAAGTKGISQKYINSSESEIFHKGRELYGIYQAKKAIGKEDRVYMVEGYTDVISMHQCGIENVVANSGTALSTDQIRLLMRFTKNITLLYDGDTAGIHAALRGTNMLLEAGMNINILLLPDGDDPDSFARKHNATEFKDYIHQHQTDFISFKTQVLMGEAGNDPQQRTALIDDIVGSISVIPEEIARSVYIHQCSEMMNMREEVLIREVARKRKARREQASTGNQGIREPGNQGTGESGNQGSASSQNPSSLTPDSEPVEGHPSSRILSQVYPEVLEGRDNSQPSTLIGLERLIMRMIVRYGEARFTYMDTDDKEVTTSVAEYVSQELEIDDLQFQYPLYREMLAQAIELIRQGATRAPESSVSPMARHFMSNPHLGISREAADLMSDKYQVSYTQDEDTSRDESSRPGDYIIHLMLDYKFAIVEIAIRQIRRQLADPTVLSDSARCAEVLRNQIIYNDLKRRLAKKLGDRVLI